MEYGLIGNPLKHSFSKEVHSYLSNYNYELCELSEQSFDSFMLKKNFKALNVTIPYKKKVIPYLDYVDENAKNIGAVNTIINKNSKLYGYNTDILGVISTFKHFDIDINNKNVLILGTGATSNTVYHAVSKLNAHKIYKAYRLQSKIKGDILYDDILNIADDIHIIVNTTSNGMYPHQDDKSLINIIDFKKLEAVMDVVYNPLRTMLLINAQNNGIKAVSGLYMLVAQAVYANKLFLGNDIDSIKGNDIINQISDIYSKSYIDKLNIVLIGMPSCGKTKLGGMIATKYKYNFIDIDKLIENKINCPISEYIKKFGEKSFRDVEEETIKEISTKNHCVIATGGGAILRENNIYNLKYNGKLFFINRSLNLLKPTNDRPLTSNRNDLEKIYNDRLPLYKKYCDVEINGDAEFDSKINDIISQI